MELRELQTKADEMAAGWDELGRHVEARLAFAEFVDRTLREHEAASVSHLPSMLQMTIAARGGRLKSDEWLAAEQVRLEQLGQELFPEIAIFMGPVN